MKVLAILGSGLTLTLVALALTVGAVLATGTTNGDFETGTLSGWTVVDNADFPGSWFAYSGTSAPLSGRRVAAPP